MPFVRDTDALDGGNGVADSCHDFIANKLVPFITSSSHFPTAADRWTLERTDSIAAEEEEIFISPPSNAPDAPVIAFHTMPDAGYMFAGTSYAAGVAAYALPGNTRQHPEDQSSAPGWSDTVNDRHSCAWSNIWPEANYLSHYLFAPSDGAYCYAMVEIATRRWRHILFGQMNKFASFTGGEFFGCLLWDQTTGDIEFPFGLDSSRWHSSIIVGSRASVGGSLQTGAFRAAGLRGSGDAPDAEWYLNGPGFVGSFVLPLDDYQRPATGSWDTANNTAIDLGKGNCDIRRAPGNDALWTVQQSLLSNSKPLLPVTFWAEGRFAGSERWMPVGQFPDLFSVHMLGFSPGQELTVGSDTFRLFPLVNSDVVNTLADEEYSGYIGIAIRVRS